MVEVNKKTYVFDIDGTICTNTYGNYTEAKPYLERIKLVNLLYDNGNTIFFATARGMGSSNNDYLMAYKKYFVFTHEQLKAWGLKFHALFLGKPSADFYIDDKAIKDNNFFGDIL